MAGERLPTKGGLWPLAWWEGQQGRCRAPSSSLLNLLHAAGGLAGLSPLELTPIPPPTQTGVFLRLFLLSYGFFWSLGWLGSPPAGSSEELRPWP